MALSPTAFFEKNKLASTHAWLVLLKVVMPDDTPFRICANNENVTWPVTDGDEYLAFPFEIDEIGDSSKGEVPSVVVRVSNVTRFLIPDLEDQDGLVDSVVTIYIVNSTNVILGANRVIGVNNSDPEIELEYEVINTSYDIQWVYFTLGATNPWNRRFPRNKVYKNICKHYDFGGDRCGYDGAETTCDRSLYTCRNVMNNSENFGGFPGVGAKGEYT